IEKCTERAKKLNPNIKVIPISARNGEGIDEWASWLKEEVRKWQE
ncbi:MAG: hydrogenase accessory protein HypB, partial [Clostridia bacterium]